MGRVIRKMVTSNLPLKLLSVGLAISLWFFVTYRSQSEMIVEAPIEFKSVPAGMEILRQNIKSVSLVIRGQERVLKNLRPMDLRVVIDLSEAKKGEETHYFDKGNIVVPRGLEVMRVDPTSVRVTLDESIAKTLPVKVSLSGTPEKGSRIKSVEVKPSEVFVEGAKTEMARVSVLRTESIDVTGLNKDLTQNVKLSKNGKNLRTAVSEVTVSIKLERTQK